MIVPDQRGYGQSDKPKGWRAYTLDLLAADVVAIAAACGRDQFDLVGHDFGGIIAWWTALRYPESVLRLVALNAPHPVAARRFAKRNWRQLRRSWYTLPSRSRCCRRPCFVRETSHCSARR